jgi:CDP-glucose 4,6-dehydratase
MEMFHSIYSGKTVLVTGHTGFKGAWLSIWLHELGAKVVGYALDPYHDIDTFVKTNLNEKIIDIRGDLLDKKLLNEVFEKHKPDIVFHLAAQPIVRDSYDIPVETFEINAIGTANILECIRKVKCVKAAVLITTDKVYENKEEIWGYREKDPLGGYDPYSSSKACAEIIINSYRQSFFQQEDNDIFIASARAGNVIGGGDWQAHRIIPDCVNSLKDGKSIDIRNPIAVRPWQHVLEAVGGYLLLGEKLMNKSQDHPSKFAEAWNFGPLVESICTVKVLAENVIKTWGSGEINLNDKIDLKKHEAQLLSLDITKVITKLEWIPVLSLEECIRMTIEWYKYSIENPDKCLYDYTVNQIKEYCEISKQKKKNWMNY